MVKNNLHEEEIKTVPHKHLFFLHSINTTYSRLSLSRLRLSGITAYLEEKIWSLFKHRNLTSGTKILWIRGEIAPG